MKMTTENIEINGPLFGAYLDKLPKSYYMMCKMLKSNSCLVTMCKKFHMFSLKLYSWR